MKNKKDPVRIKENWGKIEEYEAAAAKQTGDPKARFNASTFWFNNNGSDGRHLMLPIKYRKKNKRSESGFTKTYYDLMVYASYCPFSGKPLYEDLE